MLEAGTWLRNRIGRLQVLSVTGNRVRFRYEDGKEGEAETAALLRINKLVEDEGPSVKARDCQPPVLAPAAIQISTPEFSVKSASVFCSRCSSDLSAAPELLIENITYCYRCAKLVYDDICAHKRVVRVRQPMTAAEQTRHSELCKILERGEIARKKRNEFRASLGLPGESSSTMPESGFTDLISWLLPIVSWPLVSLIEWQKNRQQKPYRDADRLYLARNPEDEGLISAMADAAREIASMDRGYLDKTVSLTLSSSCNQPNYESDSYFRKNVLDRDGCRCQWCEKVYDADALEVHHIRPRAQFGTDHKKNLITLCIPCHMKETWFGHVHKKAPRR